jgi:hypothetical protein
LNEQTLNEQLGWKGQAWMIPFWQRTEIRSKAHDLFVSVRSRKNWDWPEFLFVFRHAR